MLLHLEIIYRSRCESAEKEERVIDTLKRSQLASYKARNNFSALCIQLSLHGLAAVHHFARICLHFLLRGTLRAHQSRLNSLVCVIFFIGAPEKKATPPSERERDASLQSSEKKEKKYIYSSAETFSLTRTVCVCFDRRLGNGRQIESNWPTWRAYAKDSPQFAIAAAIIVRSRCMHVPKIKSWLSGPSLEPSEMCIYVCAY